jgi:hypothetical protein
MLFASPHFPQGNRLLPEALQKGPLRRGDRFFVRAFEM